MTINRKIETALLALFQADATIAKIGPDLRHYFDNSVPKVPLALIVHGYPAQNANFAETAGGAWWTVRVEIMAAGMVQRDETGERVDALHARAEIILGSLTAAQVNAQLTGDLSGFTIDGIVHDDPQDVADDTIIGKTYALTLHGHT